LKNFPKLKKLSCQLSSSENIPESLINHSFNNPLLRDLSISFQKRSKKPDVNSMIKITSTLKPGSKACWYDIDRNEVALLIYLSSPHV
jgi:hypothetical protein